MIAAPPSGHHDGNTVPLEAPPGADHRYNLIYLFQHLLLLKTLLLKINYNYFLTFLGNFCGNLANVTDFGLFSLI